MKGQVERAKGRYSTTPPEGSEDGVSSLSMEFSVSHAPAPGQATPVPASEKK